MDRSAMKAIRYTVLAVCALFAPLAHAVLQIEVTQSAQGASPIAIVPFQWNVAVPPPEQMDQIISADLKVSGLFAPIDRRDFVSLPNEGAQVQFQDWRMLGATSLVVGSVRALGSVLEVRYELFDVPKGQRLRGREFRIPLNSLRALAHQISDEIYEQLTGERGAFRTKIAYVILKRDMRKKATYELQMSDYDGYNPQRLFTSPESIFSISWSPDGQKIAYASMENAPKVPVTVYVQDVYTAKRERLLDSPVAMSAPSWSPDGSRLAVKMTKGERSEIYVISLAGRTWQRVTSAAAGTFHTEPTWSPDGRSLVYTAGLAGASAHLYRADLESGQSQRVTFEGKQNLEPTFSPDGKQLGMVHQDKSGYHIAVLDNLSGSLRVLTPALTGLESPSFAPNGRMILFKEEGGARNMLSAISSDGRVKQRLTLQEDGDVREPSWGPFLSQ